MNEWVKEKKMEMQWTAELQSRKMGVKEKRWREGADGTKKR